MDPIRVFVADDDNTSLPAISDLAETDASLEFVGVAHDTSEAILPTGLSVPGPMRARRPGERRLNVRQGWSRRVTAV